jgi:hypothetical protein
MMHEKDIFRILNITNPVSIIKQGWWLLIKTLYLSIILSSILFSFIWNNVRGNNK